MLDNKKQCFRPIFLKGNSRVKITIFFMEKLSVSLELFSDHFYGQSLLTSCITAVKNMLSSTVKRYMRDLVKIYFGLLKIQVKFWINLKLVISMRPVCLIDFSTLYTTLPHNLIKDKLIDLIERTFNREGSPYLACNDRNTFFTS